MAFNGSGTFSIINTFVPGTTILSSAVNQNYTDIASGLSNCLCKDGQQTWGANQPAGNFRITSMHAGSARTDSANIANLQDGLVSWAVAGSTGSANAIVATYSPAHTALADGDVFFLRAIASTTSTTPTFNPDTLGANTITRAGGTALNAGDIPGNLSETILRYNLANTRYELLNPATFPPGTASLTPLMFANETVPFATAMINGTIVQSQAANAQTFAVKTLAGLDPSASDPVIFIFRDNTATTGDYVVLQVTAALNITIPSGGTVATQNAQTNRIWVGALAKGGTTVVLGVYNSLTSSVATSPSVICWDESTPVTGTLVASTSSSAGVWYTASAVSVAAALRVIGYAESTQATAGTWVTPPTKLKLFSAGDKKPGDCVQEVSTSYAGSTTVNSATFALFGTPQSATLTPLSAANLVRVEASGSMSVASGFSGGVKLSRGSVANTNMIGNLWNVTNASGTADPYGFYCRALDIPNTASSQAYNLQGDGNSTITTVTPVEVSAREIQV